MLKRFIVFSFVFFSLLPMTLSEVFADAVKADASLRAAYIASLRGETDKAIAAYKTAVEEDPKSAQSWFMYGQFLIFQKKPTEGIQALNTALNLNPKFPGVNLTLGQQKFHAGSYDEAIKYFQQELAANKKSGDAYYWLGRAYQEKLQMQEAREAYDKALKYDTSHDIETRAGLQIVRISNAMKGETTYSVEKAHPWNLSLQSGFLYTDNVASLDNKVAKPDDLPRRGDFGWNYGVNAGYKVIDSEHFDFRADYALNHTIYFEAEDFNQLSNGITLTPALKQGQAALLTELFWRHDTLGGDPFRYQLGFAPAVSYVWNHFRFLTGYRWAHNYYHYEPAVRDQDRDGWEHDVNLNIIYAPDQIFQYIATGLVLGAEEATGKDYDHKSLSGYVSLKTREYHKFWLKTGFWYGFSNYDQKNTAALIFESQRRRSQDVGLSAELARRLGETGASVYLNWSYVRNASNITFYSQTKNTVASGLRWEF